MLPNGEKSLGKFKCKTKPGTNKKKINKFHPDRRQNLAIKGSWFNQLSEIKAACASSLDVSVVSKKKIVGAKKSEAMLRESDFQEQARIILHRRIFHCPKRVTP